MTDLDDAWVATIVDAMDRSDRHGHDQDLWAVHHAILRKVGEQHLRILWRRACDRYSAIHAIGILPMTGRDRLHRDRCGTISIDPEDVRPDDNHPNDPPDDFSRPDLYDPYGALAVPRWVDGRLSPDDEEGMRWHRSHHFDRRAVALADRHYSRKTPGSPQFCPPGRRCVLITEAGDACWVTSAPKAEYVAHAWPGAWVNTFFRNESGHLSSGLIREALAASRAILGDPPAEGIITFIDERKIRHKRDPGRCYRKAGWRVVGRAKGGQLVLHLAPSEFPPATEPANTQMALPFVA